MKIAKVRKGVGWSGGLGEAKTGAVSSSNIPRSVVKCTVVK